MNSYEEDFYSKRRETDDKDYYAWMQWRHGTDN